MSAFDEATAVRDAGSGRYEVDLHPGWSVGGRPNGGYLMAVIARAAAAAAGQPDPLAVSAHFLAPPSGGPAEVTTEVMRQGRRISAVRATLRQDGVPLVDALVSAGSLPTAPEPMHLSGGPPQVSPVEECLPASGIAPGGARVGLHDFVDLRIDPASVGWATGSPGGSMEIRGWCRLRDGAPTAPLVLLQMGDAFPPVTFDVGIYGWVPTVELTTYLRARPAPGWLACRMAARLIGDGWIDEDAELWDSTGNLVAQARQLAGVRVRTEGRPPSGG
jgi:acyl-CoA thioesterase